MIFSFEETPASRAFVFEPPSFTLIYKAAGEHDDLAVAMYARNATPVLVSTAVGTLYRQNIRIDPDGWKQYLVTVPYGQRKQQTGSFSFSFDTTGATIKVTASKEHIASYPPEEGNPNPHRGLIGVTPDGDVEGTEMVIPALKMTYTLRHPAGVIDESFARLMARNTGKVNGGDWHGFAPGELLFLGATGSDGSESEAEVSYQMVASENATITMGDIAGIVKQGHHYAWVEYKDEVSDGEPAVQPKRVHVERLYSPVNFSTLLGF